jgi:DNA-binding NtrC family response regulator
MAKEILLFIGFDEPTRSAIKEELVATLHLQAMFTNSVKDGLEKALILTPVVIFLGEDLSNYTPLDFLGVLRQSSCICPVILITRHNEPAYLIEHFRAGINDYLLLPLAVDQDIERIQKVIEQGKERTEREKVNRKLLTVEAVQITLTTLSHYLNNYITALKGNLTLMQEMLEQKAEVEKVNEVLQKGLVNMECIQLVLQVLFNTTNITFTHYDDSVPMIDIQDALIKELNHLENRIIG